MSKFSVRTAIEGSSALRLQNRTTHNTHNYDWALEFFSELYEYRKVIGRFPLSAIDGRRKKKIFVLFFLKKKKYRKYPCPFPPEHAHRYFIDIDSKVVRRAYRLFYVNTVVPLLPMSSPFTILDRRKRAEY